VTIHNKEDKLWILDSYFLREITSFSIDSGKQSKIFTIEVKLTEKHTTMLNKKEQY